MKGGREQVIRVIRKKKAGHGHHGGAWKVAFADFMTSMMALFLVLWLITQSSEVRVAIAGYFQDPMGRAKEFGNSLIDGSESATLPGPPAIQQASQRGDRSSLIQLSKQIQAAIAASPELASLSDHIIFEMTPDGLRISLLEDENDIFFNSGGARPLPKAQHLFQAIGTLLGMSEFPVVIEGHTDAQQYPSSSAYDNWNLSTDRAEASRRLLMQGGLRSPQIKGMRGLADTDPRIPGDPRAPQNRRVTLLILDNHRI